MVSPRALLVRPVLVLLLLAIAPDSPPAAARQAAEPRVIDVLARRYVFEPPEIAVSEGETVRLMVRSGDGPHGIEIKEFKVKQELLRGAPPVAIEFTATKAGRFPILCSEYCGDGHAGMKGTLVVNVRREVP